MSEWEPPKPPGSGDGNGDGNDGTDAGGHDWKSAPPPAPEPGIPLPPAPEGLPPMPGEPDGPSGDWLQPGTPMGGPGGPGWQPPTSSTGAEPGGWLPPSGAAPPSGGGPSGGGWLPPTGPLSGSSGGPPAGGGWQPPGSPGGVGGGAPPGGWQPPGAGPGGGPGWGATDLASEAGVVRVGDIVSSASRVVAGNFGTFLVVSLAAVLPGLAITQFFTHRMQKRMITAQSDLLTQNLGYGPEDPFAIVRQMFDPADFAGICGGAFVSFVLTYMAQGILMYATVEHLAGRHAPVGSVISRGMSRAPSVLGVAFLVGLLQFVTILPGVGIGALLFAAGPAGICCGMGFMLIGILVPMFYVLILTFVAIPAAVTERIGPVAALQRSFELTKGHRVTILLSFLSLIAVIFVFSCLGGICSGAAGGANVDLATGLPKEPSALSEGINFVMTLVTSIFQTMAISSLAAVAYARIRGLKDGVDANALADVFS